MQPSSSQAGIEFLRTEIETTSVFARIAADAEDPEKRLRDLANARKGYDTLLHFMQTLPLSAEQRDEMSLPHEQIDKLRK